MRLPNLFASSRGRLTAFFLLYMTEGIPLGFAAIAVATQLRRQGVGPAEIGAFVGSFYLPWAFKWAFGPVVDVFSSERLGRRRGWILAMQILMVCTLLSSMLLTLPEQLGLFTIILLVHNTFAATQDVAIDALAINTLAENERATANGMMFAGANIGQMVGGAGSLFLASYLNFQATFVFVSAAILLVTVFVVMPLKERASAPRLKAAGSAILAAGREMRTFAVTAFRSFLGTRGSFAGLFMALLPPGAMCLGLALQSNLAVELGMNDDQVGWMNVWTSVLGAAGCIIGGRISDRVDRRKALTVYILLMSLPVLAMMGVLLHYDWIMPAAANAAKRQDVPQMLLVAFWSAVLTYSLFQGLMYSTSTAIYMDVTNPVVAGTQFTAYMALFNLAISYSATWQGIAIEAWGYPNAMLIDAFFGLTFLLILPFTRKRPGDPAGYTDALGAGRAKVLARSLAVLCVIWLPLHFMQDRLGAGLPIANTLFSLVFIGSTLFLLAGGVVLSASAAQLTRICTRFAPLMLLMLTRSYLDTIANWFVPLIAKNNFVQLMDVFYYGLPAIAAVLLWQLAAQPWVELQAMAAMDDEGLKPATA
jgi:MFS transporter, PAT family, beta-lactamase induction signal transducer AmpG